MKVNVPDGQGGWTEVEGEVAARNAKVDATRQEQALKKQFQEDAGRLVEKAWQFLSLYAKEQGLTKEQLAFAVGLLCINLREDYPDGETAFDAITAEAAYLRMIANRVLKYRRAATEHGETFEAVRRPLTLSNGYRVLFEFVVKDGAVIPMVTVMKDDPTFNTEIGLSVASEILCAPAQVHHEDDRTIVYCPKT